MQQYGPGRRIMSGALDMLSGEHRAAQTEAIGAELGQIEARISQIEATLAAPRSRETRIDPQARRDMEAEIINLSHRRAQLSLALGAGGLDASMAEAQGERTGGAEAIVSAQQRINDLNQRIAAIPTNPAAQRVLGAETFGEGVSAFGEDPLRVARTFGLRSLPASGPSILGGIVGGAMLGPIGAALGAGGSGFAVEKNLSVAQYAMEALQSSGVDVSDPDAVATYVEANPDAFNEAIDIAMTRAGIIAAADAASMGLSGAVVQSLRNASRSRQAAGAFASGTVLEPSTEMTGEALAEKATTGEISPGNVLAEGIGGLAIGGPTTALQAVTQARQPEPQDQSPVPPNYGVPPLDQPGPGLRRPSSDPQQTNRQPPAPPTQPSAPQAPSAAWDTETPQARAQAASDAGLTLAETVTAAQSPWAGLPESVQQQITQARPDLAQPAQAPQPVPAAPEQPAAQPVPPAAPNEQAPQSPPQVQAPPAPEPAPAAPQDPSQPEPPAAAPVGQESGDTSLLGPRPDQAEMSRLQREAGPNRPLTNSFMSRRIRRSGANGEVTTEVTGGVDPSGPFGQALRDRGVTGRQAPGLFRRGGLKSVDTMSPDDLPPQVVAALGMAPTSDNDTAPFYLDAEAIADAVAAEINGTARYPTTQDQQAASDALAEAERAQAYFDRIDSDPEFRAQEIARAREAQSAASQDSRFTRAQVDELSMQMGDILTEDEASLAASILMDNPDLGVEDAITQAIVIADRDAPAQETTPDEATDDIPFPASPVASGQPRAPAGADEDGESGGAGANPEGSAPDRGRGASRPEDEAGPEVDETPEGQQLVIPGAEQSESRSNQARKADQGREVAARQSARMSRGEGQQAPGGLFGGDQATLLDPAPKPRKTGGQPKGSLGPNFLDFSFTNRNSVFAAAFRAAGVEPDRGMTLPADQQIKILRRALKDRFGIEVELPTRTIRSKTITGRATTSQRIKIKTRDAIDQMLDAFRQLEMMTHVWGLPFDAVALRDASGEAVKLSLTNALPGALGAYSYNGETGGSRTIHLPGRSNSFAHEWGHALDHWMGKYLFDTTETTQLLSRTILKDGVDPNQTRNKQIAEAFVGALQAIFGDRAKLAALQLDLQQRATETTRKGKPTPGARRAQKQLDDIKAGKKLPLSVTNKYFQDSKEYDNMVGAGGYFLDPAEMFARAVETFVGVAAERVSDLPAGFLAKPDWAYRGSDEARAKRTFPKEGDAFEIAQAFTRLGDALRMNAAFGSKGKPTAPADLDVYNMKRWIEYNPPGGLLAREREMWSEARRRGRDIKNQTQRTWADTAEWHASTLRGYLRGVVARQTKESQQALNNLLDMFMDDPGSGRVVSMTYEEEVQQVSYQFQTKFDSMVREYKLAKLSEADVLELRRYLTDTTGNFRPSNDNVRKAAPNLRRLLDEMWRYLDNSGLKVGYARNGYLPRTIDKEAVLAEPGRFQSKAAEVYSVMFGNDVRAAELDDQIADVGKLFRQLSGYKRGSETGDTYTENLFSQDQVDTYEEWKAGLKSMRAAQRKLDDANKGGDGDKIATAEAALQKAADEFQPKHDGMLDIIDKVWSAAQAEAWETRLMIGGKMDFDSLGPRANFQDKRTLPPEADDILAEFYVQDPLTLIQDYITQAPRRAEYARRVGEDSQKMDNMLQAAKRAGADGFAIQEIRRSIQMLTGNAQHLTQRQGQHAWGWVYTAMTMKLLKLATFASLAEPNAAGVRLRNPMANLRALMATITQIVKTGSAADRAEMARVIGLVTSAQHDTLMMNRYGGDLDPSRLQGKMLSNFFRWNLLTPLTNMQRRAMLAVTQHGIKRMLQKGRDTDINELADLGIPREAIPDLRQWLDSLPGDYPSVDDLMDVTGNYGNAAARLWAQANFRLVSQIIQNPRRYSRPGASLEPSKSLMYGITGFIFSFHSNVLLPLLKYDIDSRRQSESLAKYASRRVYGTTRNIVQAFPAMSILFVAQGLAYMLREAMADPDGWEEMARRDGHNLFPDETLWQFYVRNIVGDGIGSDEFNRTLTRSGLMGALDIPFNIATGVKYQRDIEAFIAGPHIATAVDPIEKLLKLRVSNSENTNSAEHNALEAVAGLATGTGLPMLLSAAPGGGPLSSAAKMGISVAEQRLDFAEELAQRLYPR